MLLDNYTDVKVAYSLRKIRSGHTGYCIRVRRDSDNAVMDIGFSNGKIHKTLSTNFLITLIRHLRLAQTCGGI